MRKRAVRSDKLEQEGEGRSPKWLGEYQVGSSGQELRYIVLQDIASEPNDQATEASVAKDSSGLHSALKKNKQTN